MSTPIPTDPWERIREELERERHNYHHPIGAPHYGLTKFGEGGKAVVDRLYAMLPPPAPPRKPTAADRALARWEAVAAKLQWSALTHLACTLGLIAAAALMIAFR